MTCNYNAEDKNVMKVSAQAKNKSRLQELIDFAKFPGLRKSVWQIAKACRNWPTDLLRCCESRGWKSFP